MLWTGLPTSFTLGWASSKVEVMKNTSTFYQPDWLPCYLFHRNSTVLLLPVGVFKQNSLLIFGEPSGLG